MSSHLHEDKICSNEVEAERSAAAHVIAPKPKSEEKKKKSEKAAAAGTLIDEALATMFQAAKVKRRIRLVDEQSASLYGKKRPAAFCPIKVSQQTFDAACECDRRCMVVVQTDHSDASV